MRLVEFEAGDPQPVDGVIAVTAKSPDAKERRNSKHWFVVATITPEAPIGQHRAECNAWVKRNLARIAPHIEREYQGETLDLDFADLRGVYGD